MTAIPTSHTPGPWTVDGPKAMAIDCRVYRIINIDRYPAAFVPAWDRPQPGEEDGTDEAIANAHLIAAAPELLAIAEAALAFIDCHAADPDLTEEMVSKYNVLRLLEPHDVIAKAKGYPKPAREA